MAKIPEDAIDALKAQIDLVALIRSKGIELKPHGSGTHIGLCPFHDDRNTPNMIVNPEKRLFHCMACGAAGNAIQFIQRFEGLSFRHAFELLSAPSGSVYTASEPRKRATVPKLACPVEAQADDQKLLSQVVDYYHQRLPQSKAALDYLASRGLDDEDLLERYRIGFADRTLGLRLPHKNRVEGKRLRTRLEAIGLFRQKTGHEHFNGSIVVPILDEKGQITNLYGRKIGRSTSKDAKPHLYLPRPHRSLFNPASLQNRELILCESILDALTFIRHGMEAVTCLYGTNGFCAPLFEAIKASKLESIRIAYDADRAGEQAAARDAARFQSLGLQVYRLQLPLGEDVNSFACAQGGEALRQAVRSALWLDAPSNTNKTSSLTASPTAELAIKKDANQSSQSPPELETQGEHHQLRLGDRTYRLSGLAKSHSLEVIKVTLRLWCGDHFHLDQIDLCKDSDRKRFIERASHETSLEPELIKRDLAKLLLACEQYREALGQPSPDENAPPPMSLEQREAALQLLQSPHLVAQLQAHFESCGLVGESTNKLVTYLGATSRLLAKPLAIIIQSTSAAGKTTLMEAALSFFPAESRIKYSAMTGQSLYYLGEKDLRHKILAIVEEEGAERASYALKLLQSEGELTIASTGKDPQTGRMQTAEYHVEGPIAILLTTTNIDIDEELQNRCLILTVDESQAQTQAIHALQREARTLEGLRRKKRRQSTLALLQNAQRLLTPHEIVNPYADQLQFSSQRTRTRRDHEKYLGLIDAITLLHQHQRPIENDPQAGQHIKTTTADIELANQLATEVLSRSLDELPAQTRYLLERIKALVLQLIKARETDQRHALFTRRLLRERTGWSEFQIRAHLQKLEDYEYVQRRQGRQGTRCVYELLIDANEPAGTAHIGLIDIAKLTPPTHLQP